MGRGVVTEFFGPGGLAEPLASNFSLYAGEVKVDVPKVPGRDDYQVVCEYISDIYKYYLRLTIIPFYSVFGDSGNESPFFTIANSMLAPAILI